jgi:hypothetical protein
LNFPSFFFWNYFSPHMIFYLFFSHDFFSFFFSHNICFSCGVIL